MFEQLRQAVDDALNRKGMIVGLPCCTVDASQLKHLLDSHDTYKHLLGEYNEQIVKHEISELPQGEDNG